MQKTSKIWSKWSHLSHNSLVYDCISQSWRYDPTFADKTPQSISTSLFDLAHFGILSVAHMHFDRLISTHPHPLEHILRISLFELSLLQQLLQRVHLVPAFFFSDFWQESALIKMTIFACDLEGHAVLADLPIYGVVQRLRKTRQKRQTAMQGSQLRSSDW